MLIDKAFFQINRKKKKIIVSHKKNIKQEIKMYQIEYK